MLRESASGLSSHGKAVSMGHLSLVPLRRQSAPRGLAHFFSSNFAMLYRGKYVYGQRSLACMQRM